MMPYTVLFFSSDVIALPLLEALCVDSRFMVRALFCQPDREAGRHLKIQENALKKAALLKNIPVYQPESLSKEQEAYDFFQKEGVDFILTFSYGQFLNKAWLTLPQKAALNVHPSLLPKYRGPTPVQAALLNGDEETGVSLIQMTEAMDAGDLAAQLKCKVPPHASAGFLYEHLGRLVAEKFPDVLEEVALKGAEVFRPQGEEGLSFCKKITKEDGRLSFQDSAENILRRFRAYTPWPGIFTSYKGKRLKLLDVEQTDEALEPGKIHCEKRSFSIGTLDGALKVKLVQLEGKTALHVEAFLLGQPGFCSETLPS